MDPIATRIEAVGRTIAGLSLLAVVIWAAIEAIVAEPAIAGSIIAAVATAAGGIAAVAYQQSRAERARVVENHRKRMEPVYEEFIEKAAERFGSDDQPMTPEDVAFFTRFRRKELLLRSAPEVIKAYNAWVDVEPSPANPTAPALAYETLLRAIRCDLGHRDSKLRKEDLLRLFSDIRTFQEPS